MRIIALSVADVSPDPEELADVLAWVNDDEDNTVEDYPGRGWDDPGFEPTLEDEAEERGYAVGIEDGLPGSPAGWPDSARMAYARGRQRGMRTRQDREEREEIELNDWLEDLAMEREGELMLEERRLWHEAEIAEAVGSIETRKRGGA